MTRLRKGCLVFASILNPQNGQRILSSSSNSFLHFKQTYMIILSYIVFRFDLQGTLQLPIKLRLSDTA